MATWSIEETFENDIIKEKEKFINCMKMKVIQKPQETKIAVYMLAMVKIVRSS